MRQSAPPASWHSSDGCQVRTKSPRLLLRGHAWKAHKCKWTSVWVSPPSSPRLTRPSQALQSFLYFLSHNLIALIPAETWGLGDSSVDKNNDKNMLCKPENLSSNPRYLHKNLYVTVHAPMTPAEGWGRHRAMARVCRSLA